MVNILCRAAEKKPQMLEELVTKRDLAVGRRAKIASLIEIKNSEELIIDSSA